MGQTESKIKNEGQAPKISFEPIVINPFPFFIGGIGSVGVGSITDEYRNSLRSEEENNNFLTSTLRSLTLPIKAGVRFLVGGIVRVLLDTIIVKLTGKTIPALSGGLLGMIMASAARGGVFWGCTLGLALFCHYADRIYYSFQQH